MICNANQMTGFYMECSTGLKWTKAATWCVLWKKVFLEMSQNSQEKRVSAEVFSCEFCEISKNTFFIEHL